MELLSLHDYNVKRFVENKLSGSVGFVPTMGALHQGHLYLVERALKENDAVVVSIFVNPTQFNNPEDFKAYPKNIEKDLSLLDSYDNLYVVCPEYEEIYPSQSTYQAMPLGSLGEIMEGKHRPGHFEGVAHVVHNLFVQIRPHKAYFGEKDFQQLALIRQVNAYYNFKIQIVACSTQRDLNGLALSSRNQRLSEQGISTASEIFSLFRFIRANKQGMSVEEMKAFGRQYLTEKGFQVEYIDFRDNVDLSDHPIWKENTLCFVAASLEGVRLIDNMLI